MEDLNFKDTGVRDQVKDVLLPIWNAYSFFVTYANLDGYQGDESRVPAPTHLLDRWILAKLHLVEKRVTQAYRSFYLNQVLGPILEFLDDLTNWYIRQSRERFWAEGMPDDKRGAYDTLFFALCQLLRLLAPSAPFLTDTLYQRLTGRESVHLAAFPVVPDVFRDDALIEQVRLVRVIASLGLALRQKAGIRSRQPLRAADCVLPAHVPREAIQPHVEVLRNELNVKEIRFLDDPAGVATVRVTLNFRTLGPKLGRDIQEVNAAAKAGQVREENGQVVVTRGDREWRLDPADVTLVYQGREGAEVLSGQGVVVALDKTLTDELREEGVANDLNRAIQDLRREAGYQVSDRIWLDLRGDLAEPWPVQLARLALAELREVPDAEADASREIEIEGRRFQVRLRRPSK
jgi:isoleucyl-tRNA synthetase